MQFTRRSLCYFALPALVAFAGCGEDDGPSAPGPAGFTTPEEVIAAYAQAWSDRDVEACVALLEPTPTTRAAAGFRWYPQTQDLSDFPWMDGETSWDVAAEIDMITNMCNPDFVSGTTGQSVDTIAMEVDIEATEELPENEISVVTHADVQVLWAEEDGLRSDVRLEFLLVRGDDGFLRIRSIHELAFGYRSSDSSFSLIKSLYRSPLLRYTTAAQVIGAYAQAMDDRDIEAYVDLLEPGFRWYPQAVDLYDFPWLVGADSWSRPAEIDMVSHLFDPTFVSGTTGQSIDTIDADIELESEEYLTGIETLAKCHAYVTFLWAEADGMRSDTLLHFVLSRQVDGSLKIRSIRELSLFRSVENSSLSAIKNLYR